MAVGPLAGSDAEGSGPSVPKPGWLPTRVPLRGESGRRGPVPTKLRRWLLRGRPENHQTGRCGMRAGKSLVDRGYTHGDWLQLRRDLSSSTHVRQRGGRVADSLCARSSQDMCQPPGKRGLSLWARKEVQVLTDQPPLSHRSIGSLKSCVTCLSKIYSAHGGLQIGLPVLLPCRSTHENRT